MTSTNGSIRDMLSKGDVRAILDMLDMDRREEYTLRSINVNVADGTVVIAQIGRAMIVADQHSTQITVHGHDEADDDECWEHLTTSTARDIDAHNVLADGIRADVGAQRLLSAGASEEMVAHAWQMRQRGLAGPDTDGMPAIGNPFMPTAPVSAPVADLDGPTVDLHTGYYL